MSDENLDIEPPIEELAEPLPRCNVCGRELEFGTGESRPGLMLRCVSRHCGVVLEQQIDGDFRTRTFQFASTEDTDSGRHVSNNYSLLVLPFLLDDADRKQPFAAIEKSARWQRREFSPTVKSDVDRTEYFLPYIRRFLFPSLFKSAMDGPELQTCRHYEFPLELLGGNSEGLQFDVGCWDTFKEFNQTFPVSLDRIELTVFSYRVGFLILRVRCNDEEATFFDQMKLAHTLRFIRKPHDDFALPILCPKLAAGHGDPTQSTAYDMPRLVSWLLDEFRRDTRPSANTPTEQPTGGPSLHSRLPVRLVYDDRLLVYTFSCLDKSSCLDDPDTNRTLLARHVVVRFDEETQATGRARTPDRPGDDWRRKRWESYSKDGGCLVVFDTDEYHRTAIGGYWETYYFDVFLLAALQRVTLLSLFERMADIRSLTGSSHESRVQLRNIRYDLLVFKNQCCFSQITNRERGLTLWRKWQNVFETESLLREVNEQSEQLDGFLEIRSRDKNERLLRLAGVVTTVTPAIFGLEVVFGEEPWLAGVKWALLIALFIGVGLSALIILNRERREM